VDTALILEECSPGRLDRYVKEEEYLGRKTAYRCLILVNVPEEVAKERKERCCST
jgi:hypothetical protein